MDVVESQLAPEQLSIFQETRRKHYSSFIVEEALVGENICVETLYAITSREVEAGRMAPDHNVRKAAEMGVAEPHMSRAELVQIASAQEVRPPSAWKRLLRWFRRG